jgi:ABC-type sulfate transport system permease component
MRQTRIGMIAVGLALWLIAIASPGWQMPIMLLGVAMVMAAVFGLLVVEQRRKSGQHLDEDLLDVARSAAAQGAIAFFRTSTSSHGKQESRTSAAAADVVFPRAR